jgi:O-antigen/teichoic acid export membrane protein
MLRNKIKDIAKDSSIYGLSKFIGQAVSFFLIPLYTNYLSPEDYGILGILGLASVSFGIFMTLGIDSATYRYVGMINDEEIQKKYVTNAQILTIISILFSLFILILFSNPINKFTLNSTSPPLYLFLAVGNAVFSTISSIPRAFLRINRKVKVIAISSLINVFASIGSTLIFVVVLKYGVAGALLGNLLGTLISSLYIVSFTNIPKFTDYNWQLSKELIYYCLPTLPTQLFAFAIPLYSQWSVKQLLSLNDLGLYAVGLKFTLPLTLVLGVFQQSYAPYKFQILKEDKDPKKTFSNIMNLFVIGFGMANLFISFFGGDILKLMTSKSYHQASNYVFYIALIPFAQGLYFMFSAGLEFAKSPIYRPLISGAGLLTVLLCNHWLISHLGVPGAAISIILSWIVMAIGNLIYAQKLYPIKYNWLLILTIILAVPAFGYIISDLLQVGLVIKAFIFIIVLLVLALVVNQSYDFFKLLKIKECN